MNKTFAFVTIAISVIVSIASYYTGKNHQECEDYYLYGHYFSEATLAKIEQYADTGLEPDTIFYCEECDEIKVIYPGMKEHFHKEKGKTFTYQVGDTFKVIR